MKKQLIIWSLISAFIMLGLPWLAVAFAPADAGMALCFLLFYAVNPIYSVLLGCIAGKEHRSLWLLPLISSVLFLIGVGVFFTVSEPIFLMYAFIYLILGIVAMLIVSVVNKGKKHKV